MNHSTQDAADDRAILFELVGYYEEQLESGRQTLQQYMDENERLQRQRDELIERLNRYDRIFGRLREKFAWRFARRGPGRRD